MFRSYVFVVIILLMECRSEDAVLPHILTASYSQVSHSGSARSNARTGQAPWTHSSDAHIVRGQNLPNRKHTGQWKKHFEDSIGEVIQERFNPRPWFSYENKEPGPTYIPPQNINNKKPNMGLPVTSDSFSIPTNNEKPSSMLKPPFDGNDNDNIDNSQSQLPLNTYGSPYDSYNPKPLPATKSPLNFVTPNKEYLPPEPEMNEEMKYPHGQNDQHQPEEANDDMDLSVPVPLKYTSPYDEIIDHPPINHDHDHGYHHIVNHDDSVPEYLSTFDHHPVYYEVKTTTTEAPENQRLNKRPYSYYYIGRKLWYIPLYFSVYFIIYIFVLILKSIARHKITFNQYFEQDKREMKDMHEVHEEHIHEVEHHVLGDIMNARKKFIM